MRLHHLLNLLSLVCLLTALILVSGCMPALHLATMIPPMIDETRPPPSDWPVLTEQLHRHESMFSAHSACSKGGATTPGGFSPNCTLIDFCSRTADIHWSMEIALPHERKHRDGYDHYDSTVLRDAWENWKGEPRNFCRLRMGEVNFCNKWPEVCGEGR